MAEESGMRSGDQKRAVDPSGGWRVVGVGEAQLDGIPLQYRRWGVCGTYRDRVDTTMDDTYGGSVEGNS